MGTGARTAMPTDTDILTLAQWFSPAFPVGAFNFSHGLERAAEIGSVHDCASLASWLQDILQHGTGRNDALFLAAGYHATDDAGVANINDICRAFAPCAERLQETDLQGDAFCKMVRDLHDIPLRTMAYPVAVGRAALLCGLPLRATSQMYLHAFAANLISAGQRLAAIGQSEAQSLLHDLQPLCLDIAQDTNHGDLEHLSATAFLSDIASMTHETQYSRIFRT